MIDKITLGEQKDIPYAEFGSGDILVVTAIEQTDNYKSLLLFYQSPECRKIGDNDNSHDSKMADEIPNLGMVLKFTDPRSICVLIESLNKIQESMLNEMIENND